MKKVTLQGKYITLELLSQGHYQGLVETVSDGQLWNVKETKVPTVTELSGFLEAAEEGFANGSDMAFAIIDKASEKVVGSTRYMKVALEHKRVEVGYTFIAESFQRSYVNTEAKLLLLTHAFETLKLNRVEFLTDNLNHKSRAALERLGAEHEATLRMHMLLRDGY
ncbi:MAG: RimJ/RimL family protein N-acetyltransferase, partial [Alteromonadaceae bacterium]